MGLMAVQKIAFAAAFAIPLLPCPKLRNHSLCLGGTHRANKRLDERSTTRHEIIHHLISICAGIWIRIPKKMDLLSSTTASNMQIRRSNDGMETKESEHIIIQIKFPGGRKRETPALKQSPHTSYFVLRTPIP
jgi:hypothetical protein